MRNPNYKEWVKTIKEGDLVLFIDNHWSAPVIFLSWNGDSASTGYRSQHLYIPSWNHIAEEEAVEEQWKEALTEFEKHGTKSRYFDISPVTARAEERYFPFPTKFLTKNQSKFIKLINKIKNYEY